MLLTQDRLDQAERHAAVQRATLGLKRALPCPGCGLTAELEILETDPVGHEPWYRVRCGWCDWQGPECDTPALAVAEWNTRGS
ncbi:hypothetical protein [Deferrisoma camini]|uniref:hypothetical protein n=1 Tax=Deferrisoma camini TaxID=1035120 RepID=UPI00046D39CF|nr:hypothetical protein [Deferrisoma camini]